MARKCGRAGLVIVGRLRLFALFAAKGRIHQHHVKELRRSLEKTVVSRHAAETVAVPDTRLVNAVQDQIGQRDGINRVVLLAAVKSRRFSVSSCGPVIRSPALSRMYS